MHTKKTSAKNSTLYECAEFALDELWHIPVALALSGEKRFQMSGDDSIERVVFQIARPVRGIGSHEGIA